MSFQLRGLHERSKLGDSDAVEKHVDPTNPYSGLGIGDDKAESSSDPPTKSMAI